MWAALILSMTGSPSRGVRYVRRYEYGRLPDGLYLYLSFEIIKKLIHIRVA